MADETQVALASLAALATCVACMVWVVKKVLNDIAPALNNHTKAADRLKIAVDKNTEVSGRNIEVNQEMLTFMKKLNGKLPKLVEEKVEQASKE